MDVNSYRHAKSQVDLHIESFNFETKTKKLQTEWVIELNRLLKIFRQAKGR